MIDERDLLERALSQFPPRPGMVERVHRRNRRKLRNRRVGAATLAAMLTVVLIAGLIHVTEARHVKKPAGETTAPTPTASVTPLSIIGLDGMISALPGLPTNARQIDLSPDGTTVTFAEPSNGGWVIARAPIDGGRARQITGPSMDGHYPAWSPDGSKIAFVAGPQSSDPGIFVVDANGSHLQQLTNERHATKPSWSPDGAYLAYSTGVVNGVYRNEVFTISTQGGPATPLTRGSSPDWSPDGTQIAFDGYSQGIGIIDVTADGQLLRPVSGGERFLLLKVSRGRDLAPYWRGSVLAPNWSPDGNHIAFVAGCFGQGSGSGVGVAVAATGKVAIILGCNAYVEPGSLSWLPSGKELLLVGPHG